jgi:hypothetical protein
LFVETVKWPTFDLGGLTQADGLNNFTICFSMFAWRCNWGHIRLKNKDGLVWLGVQFQCAEKSLSGNHPQYLRK